MDVSQSPTVIWAFLTRDISLWGGLHSPALSWFGAAGMILYFAWHVGRLLHGVSGARRAFQRIQPDLIDLTETRRRLYGDGQWLKARTPAGSNRARGGAAALTCTDLDDVQKLDTTLQQEPLFRQPWAHYRKTLVVERGPWFIEPRIFSTCPAAEFFSQEGLFTERLNLAFYHQLPSLMTGIGLMLTFMAILVGLSKLHAEGSNIVGIDGLINGLAGKFLTSIVGLICANVMVVIEHRVVGRLTHLHYQVLDVIDELFPRKTLEQMVENLAMPSESDRASAGRPTLNLGDARVSTSADHLSPALTALTAAVRSLNARRPDDRGATADLRGLDDFAKTLREGLEPKITEMNDAMYRLIGSLEESRIQQKESQTRLDTLLTRLSRTVESAVTLHQTRTEKPPSVTFLPAHDTTPRPPRPLRAASDDKTATHPPPRMPPSRPAPISSQPLRASTRL